MKASIEDLEKELWLRTRNSGKIVWTTKNGTEVPINEMTDEHLVNTMNMIYRQIPQYPYTEFGPGDADNM